MKGGYFQQQAKYSSECGTCSVNNFLGKKVYDQTKMQEICFRLSDKFINPHKHVLGGDYDINVLSMALLQNGYSLEWKKNQQQIEDLVADPKIEGFLLNRHLQKKGFFQKLLNKTSRHWTSARKFSKEEILFFDSKIQNPLNFKCSNFIQFLKEVEKQKGSIICLIMKDVSSNIQNGFLKISQSNKKEMEKFQKNYLMEENSKVEN